MRTIRIHIEQPIIPGEPFALPPQAGEHVVRVLRMAEGDALVLFNGDGHDYDATLIEATRRCARVVARGARPNVTESPLSLVLAQGVARGEKMDLIVQKATELGVHRIVPLLTERSEVRLDAARAEKRLAHWRAVIASACEQSGRARLPAIDAPVPLADWLAGLDDDGSPRLALLPDGTRRIAELPAGMTRAVLVVGPEGGLGERDTTALASHGFDGLKLGPRILRTETAGLAALAAMQALYGDA